MQLTAYSSFFSVVKGAACNKPTQDKRYDILSK